VEAIIIST